MAPSILIDNASPDITFSGEQWQSGFDTDVHGGSFNTCRTDVNTSVTTGTPPTMSLYFSGTAISFYGQPSEGFALNYTFDNSRSRVADLNITENVPGKLKTGVRLWGVDRIAAGSHSVSLIPTGGRPSFDYAVVTPTTSSPLNEKTLVLDDTDPLIKYTGTWTPQSGKRFPNGIPFGDTSRSTTKKGDGFTLGFVGASISVYGLLNQLSGTLSSTYSIDGGTPVKFTAYNGTQTSAPDVWALSQRFFHKEVVPGNHTLTVTVSEITESQMFWIDYLTFEGTSMTSLTPKTEPSSGNKSNDKLIGGIVAAGIVCIIIFSCMRARLQRTVKAWWGQDSKSDTYIPPPVIYEHPMQPPPPSHFAHPGWGYGTGPVTSDPAVPHLQREVDILRMENERIQREVAERMRREAEEHIQRETSEQMRREAVGQAQREAVERSQRAALERAQRETQERTQREADERARREASERTSPHPTAPATDAGPAEPPPPYNDSHYIP